MNSYILCGIKTWKLHIDKNHLNQVKFMWISYWTLRISCGEKDSWASAFYVIL